AAAGPELGVQPPVAQHVLDLGGEVVAHAGKLRVELAHQLERVARPVEEVGIPEGDMPCPGRDELTDVLQNHGAGDREETAAVHRRDGAMEAGVPAPATCLDVSRRDEPVIAREPYVSRQRRQRRATGQRESHRSEEHTSELQSPYDLVCRLLLEKK